MKKIYQYILLAVAMVATASCSNELDDTLQPVENGNLQFVVSDFPAFGEGTQTRAIGTPDAGKTAWEAGDNITVTFTSSKYGEQTATLTYDGSAWTSTINFMYLENEMPTVTAVYNPSATPGLGEYLTTTDYTIADNTLNISFANATRTYSRLRIAGLTNQTLTVTTANFTPAGPEGATAPESYTLTTDDNGNAYLYGTFAEGATVTVKKGDSELVTYPFTTATIAGKSYALFAGVTVDLSKQTETYVINDSENYRFTGTGSYGIKVESGNPGIVLNNASITVGELKDYDNIVNALDIVADNSETTVYVVGRNNLTSNSGAGIYVAQNHTVTITGNSRDDILTARGSDGSSGIGGYKTGNTASASCGNISITNVQIEAYGSFDDIGNFAPGIGGAGDASCGTITIDNATVYAYGVNVQDYSSSAIGGGLNMLGNKGSFGTITIQNGSEVYVQRGNSYSNYIGYSGYNYEPAAATDGIIATVDETSTVTKLN